jgi:2-polyprenyl-3-methyl-5-hydroxy-6-metoxy-1,4-benzoquinol methylase
MSEMAAAIGKLNDTIAQHMGDRERISVLEAGGGSRTVVDFPEDNIVITTIDISPVQLEQNSYADNKILGDLCTYTYEPADFDLIVCMEVLEHLEDPISAVKRFVPALRPGGLIVLGAPNPLSLAGLITKFTPFSIHVLFYRYVHRNPNAGKPGYFPFPTTLRFSIAPHRLARTLAEAGMEIVHCNVFEGEKRRLLRDRFPPIGATVDALVWLLRMASGGRYRPELSDYHLIARKPSPESRSHDDDIARRFVDIHEHAAFSASSRP